MGKKVAKEHMDTDNSVVMARGKGELVEVGKEGVIQTYVIVSITEIKNKKNTKPGKK